MSNVILLTKISCPCCSSQDLIIKPNISKNSGIGLEKIDYLCVCNACVCLWGMANNKPIPEHLEAIKKLKEEIV